MSLDSAAWYYLDTFLFVALPYLALAVFFIGTIERYRRQSFTYSSLSSQLLENRQHFWAMVPFHYGILVILGGHVVAFLVPRAVLAWNGRPLRLYILEVSALAFALLALVGLLAGIHRRLRSSRMRVVTSGPDWVVFGMLLLQVFSGIYIAIYVGWGSSWFAATVTPYLRSLAAFNPRVEYMAGMPWSVRLHVINAFLLIAFFPFTRLVHILVVPNMYLWRRPQVVRWIRERRAQPMP